MLSKMLQKSLNPESLTYHDEEDLKSYLTKLVNKAKLDQNNALTQFQNRQAIRNIENQVVAMKRYTI